MALEVPGSTNFEKWKMPSKEALVTDETINFNGTINELLNRYEYIQSGHALNDKPSKESEDTNQDILDRLYKKAMREYFIAMSQADDVRAVYEQMRQTCIDKLGIYNPEIENWLKDLAEKEIVKTAVEELGHEVVLLTETEMRNFDVDFAIKYGDGQMDITVMHQIPVLEFPNNTVVYSDTVEDFSALIKDEDVDTGSLYGAQYKTQDIEDKKRAMKHDFSAIAGSHKDKRAIEKSTTANYDELKHLGAIITIPNTRSYSPPLDRKNWEPKASEELEINLGFIDWNEMEPGDILRNSLRRSLGDARESRAA